MSWKTTGAPKDGTPIVAVGRVTWSDEDSGGSWPFATAIFWNGEAGWCLWQDEYHLSVSRSPDEQVKVDFWMEYPKEEFSRPVEQRPELVPHGANPKAGKAGELSGSNVDLPTPLATLPKLVRRCLWCVEKIRLPSYYVGGTWQTVISPARFFGADAQFTDGICPECSVAQQRLEQARKVKVGV